MGYVTKIPHFYVFKLRIIYMDLLISYTTVQELEIRPHKYLIGLITISLLIKIDKVLKGGQRGNG